MFRSNEKTNTDTFKCPTCGTKVLVNTEYCLTCKKKVKPPKGKEKPEKKESLNVFTIENDVKLEQDDQDLILERGDRVRILSIKEEASQYMPQTKDWERMLDLVLAGKDGASVAKSIKDKKKAAARYIAGSKLGNSDLFSSFYDKAIKLGANADEINQALNNTVIPDDIAEKYMNLKNKKLDNVFVGAISKEILKLGFDINFLSKCGALTFQGKQSMRRNGRKWTIGYKTEIIINDKKVDFSFDAITDEGGGTTFYAINTFDDKVVYSNVLGRRELLAWLKNELNKMKENIIEIQEEVRIPQEDIDIILEKGDKIEVLKENRNDPLYKVIQAIKDLGKEVVAEDYPQEKRLVVIENIIYYAKEFLEVKEYGSNPYFQRN